MERSEAEQLAKELIAHHLPNTGWKFSWLTSRAVNRLGLCHYKHKTISLGPNYVDLNDIDSVKDTILHEIAHALVGPGHGHGPVWQAKCLEVGANPSRTAEAFRPPFKYVIKCMKCEKTLGYRDRMNKKMAAFGRSGCCKYPIRFELNTKGN